MASLPHRLRVFELLQDSGRPLHVAEIASRLGVDPTLIPGLTAMLDDMVLSGGVRAFPGHRYRVGDGAAPERERPVRLVRERPGVLTVNPRGFGFVASAGTGEPDVYVSSDMLHGAMHGDRVVVRVIRTSSRGPEGEIVRVEQRAIRRVPGVVRRRGKSVWLEPDDARMRGPIPLGKVPDELNAQDGDAAIAVITRYPEQKDELPEATLDRVLGRAGDPKVEIEKVLAREEVVETFPEAVSAEARAFGDAITDAQIEGREDLRPLPLLTIDPADARDHDDAVYVRRATEHDGEEAAYVAWIAIADVSAYVTPGSGLDAEAMKRSTSIYLPDRAIPMLPRELSTHLCSLVPNEDRLCLAVEVVLDATATPLRHRFVEGVMRSRAKLSYEDVARALGFTDDAPATATAKQFLPSVSVAWELSSLLRARRMRRGALDFDLPEPKVVLDETGVAKDVVRARRDPGVKKAYNLIEELMLLANEVVAEDLTGRTVPTVYRVHATPDEMKVERFANLATSLGMPFDPEHAKDPKALGKFLRVIATHPQAAVLNSLLLRAMKQATYDVVNIGHFGLASTAYLHFTSPIRRYPDLVVHRAVHHLCQGRPAKNDEEALKEAALLASQNERKAMDVEREVVDLHRALLMRNHLGETFEGTVSALVGSGAFVAIDAPYVDVLVKFEAMGNEPYELDDEGLAAIGQRSGDVVRLGDRMAVRIDDVSIERRTVLGTRLAAIRLDQPERPTRRRGQGHGDVRDKKLAGRRSKAAAEDARRKKGKATGVSAKAGGGRGEKPASAAPRSKRGKSTRRR
ncbi:MAG: ribonuclease R [Deltaproteobacteria bacterium]|nr:ribonuclease R [Deltaproteobacteria bacterium]